MSRAARAPPTAPPRHASDHHALVPRTPLRRTCLCRVYTHMHMHALQDLLVPLRLWMDVDLGIAVGAACSRRRLGAATAHCPGYLGAGYLGRTYLGLAMQAAHLPGSSPAWGWLLRLLPRYALGRTGPNGRLRCGHAARPKSPIPPPTSPPRCTLARAASHSTCGRRIWRCMRGRASHCEPWLRAMSRSSWPRAARMVGKKTSWQQQSWPPTARGAQGPRRPRARPRARVWRLSGLQHRPTAAWAASSAAFAPCPRCRPRRRLHRPLRSEAAVRVSVAERCVQQTVDKPMLCKCVVFEEQLEEVATALCARGRTPGD